MTNPTTHGQVPAIQRYSIGYHSDEWGVRSLSPSGIYDDAGPWVRYKDHVAVITTLRAQQPSPSGEESKPHGWLYDWTHSSATGKRVNRSIEKFSHCSQYF